MCWTSPDCLSGCKHRTARNADGEQARAQSKPDSRAGRNKIKGENIRFRLGVFSFNDSLEIIYGKVINPIEIAKYLCYNWSMRSFAKEREDRPDGHAG